MTFAECAAYIKTTFGVEPDCPFEGDFSSAVFRHRENKKWFALYMQVSGKLVGLPEELQVDILNVKCDPLLCASLSHQPGFRPAYHMNKTHWLTILLSHAPADTIRTLLAMSFDLTR